MNNHSIDVLIVDDSAVVRGLLTRVLETDDGLRVAGTAMHGELALSWLRDNHADVVILDVEMPVMDGITTLTHIQERHPQIPVVMASSLTQKGAETTVKALALGAAGCIAKPAGQSMSDNMNDLSREMVPLIKALAQKSSAPAAVRRSSKSTTVLSNTGQSFNPTILVIGSSTGGPKALSVVLAGLPADFPLPILIVQHMPPTFTPMLAKHLGQDSGRPSQEGFDGGLIERNNTYIAPGDFHMSIDKKDDRMIMRLDKGPEEHFCRPSVNPLFRSAASWYGKNVLAVMLTGMGSDGIEGTREIVENGGYVIAQDQATSVVWGMPAAVVNENLANQVLPLKQIAPTILNLCKQEAMLR